AITGKMCIISKYRYLVLVDITHRLYVNSRPGYSSLFGLSVENGRFKVTKGSKIKKQKYSWTKGYSMIYFDFPICL
ncbi:venom serine carboxypeptidase-like protein, partial [Leptotrombidium deliense]